MRESYGLLALFSRSSRSPGLPAHEVEAGGSAPATVAMRGTGGRRHGPAAVRMAARLLVLFLFALVMLGAPRASSARVIVGVTVSYGPPLLPYYVQPLFPGPGYIWTPGFWAWDPYYGYYWVPGTWVLAPFPGALWTPGYWGWDDGLFVWNEGYWGPVVGFYGGINYGYGYTGYGYQGGYWRGGSFYYNRSVNNITTTNITNVYNQTVVNNTNVTRVSYNGGPNGTTARPTRVQLEAAGGRHFGPVPAQREQERTARAEPRQRASLNHGHPGVAATRLPGAFRASSALPAREDQGQPREVPRRHEFSPRTSPRPEHPAHPNRREVFTPSEHAAPRARIERPAPMPRQPEENRDRRREPDRVQPRVIAPRRMSRSEPARPPEARPRAMRQAGPPQEHGNPHRAEGRGNGREHKPGGPDN